MKVIDFSLPDENGKLHSLLDYMGKWVLLYFYPKDDTPGCTKEACGFRDSINEFQKRGIVILGVSKDSIASHKKFHDKYHLNFTILSDPEKEVLKKYKAWGKKTFMGRTFDGTLRISYLINPQGEIIKKYEKVNPLVHAAEILKDFDSQAS